MKSETAILEQTEGELSCRVPRASGPFNSASRRIALWRSNCKRPRPPRAFRLIPTNSRGVGEEGRRQKPTPLVLIPFKPRQTKSTGHQPSRLGAWSLDLPWSLELGRLELFSEAGRLVSHPCSSVSIRGEIPTSASTPALHSCLLRRIYL